MGCLGVVAERLNSMYPFKRKSDSRLPKRRFVISVEGAETEDEYLKRLGKLFWDRVIIDVPKNVNKSAPNYVLERIQSYRGRLNKGDEMWCVIDSDRWTMNQKLAIQGWSKKHSGGVNRFLGLSNPKIELWIAMHLDDVGPDCTGFTAVIKKYCNGKKYKKHIDNFGSYISKESIKAAISRAKKSCPTGRPPIKAKGTNLWVLAEHIMNTGHV